MRAPLIALLLVDLMARGPSGLPQSPGTSISIQSVVGCLVTEDFVIHDLEQIGRKPGDQAGGRFHVGSIPGMMPTPGEYYIAVYDKDESHGWLLMAFRDGKNSLVPVRYGYRLTKNGSQWTADEGNGGLATYRAMSRFATTLFESPSYHLNLSPGSCAAGMNP